MWLEMIVTPELFGRNIYKNEEKKKYTSIFCRSLIRYFRYAYFFLFTTDLFFDVFDCFGTLFAYLDSEIC